MTDQEKLQLEYDARRRAMDHASILQTSGATPDVVLDAARKYYKFLMGEEGFGDR